MRKAICIPEYRCKRCGESVLYNEGTFDFTDEDSALLYLKLKFGGNCPLHYCEDGSAGLTEIVGAKLSWREE